MKNIKNYSMKIALLNTLYEVKLITEKEYLKIKNRLDKDHKSIQVT